MRMTKEQRGKAVDDGIRWRSGLNLSEYLTENGWDAEVESFKLLDALAKTNYELRRFFESVDQMVDRLGEKADTTAEYKVLNNWRKDVKEGFKRALITEVSKL